MAGALVTRSRDWCEQLMVAQVNLIAFEYQGYGIASGTATPAHIKNDEVVILKFLEFLKIKPKNIIVFGRSIGMYILSLLLTPFRNRPRYIHRF